MARKRQANDGLAEVAAELDAIKKLAILQLLVSGVQATQIAKALGVDKSTISRMVPARGIKKALSRS